MSTTVWTVTGMTCGHCVKAVTEEVSALPGVTDVDVDLESGRVTVTADTDPDAAALAAAVDEAGYTLVTA
ncbi:MAG: heavy-metal-associated domain-containing protein [Candidatus Nanopelagicales bacterium]